MIQFLAAFPPNMLYPFVDGDYPCLWSECEYLVCAIDENKYAMVYFVHVISAVQTIDKELVYVVKHLNVSGYHLWRRLIIPSVAPHLVSGAMAASGGAWNASIVAEVLTWGGQTKMAVGLGSYIHHCC